MTQQQVANGHADALNQTLRKLWEQHVMWTRSFIISTAANLGDLQPVTQRLLRIPGDFARVLVRFYGPQRARRFQQLLTDHLLIAAALVNSAKAGHEQEVARQRALWYQNADEIAAFLAHINPHWQKSVWQEMLRDHLKMTENEATYRLRSQYAADIAEYDKIQQQALQMADYMSEGICKQFGGK